MHKKEKWLIFLSFLLLLLLTPKESFARKVVRLDLFELGFGYPAYNVSLLAFDYGGGYEPFAVTIGSKLFEIVGDYEEAEITDWLPLYLTVYFWTSKTTSDQVWNIGVYLDGGIGFLGENIGNPEEEATYFRADFGVRYGFFGFKVGYLTVGEGHLFASFDVFLGYLILGKN